MRKRGFSFRSARTRTSDAPCMEYAEIARGGFDDDYDRLASPVNDLDEQSEALSMEHATSEVLKTPI